METYNLIQFILVFIIGWLCSSIWNYFLNFGLAALMVKHVSYSVMCYAQLIHESSKEFMEIKYNSLKQLGVNVNDIKRVRNEDEHVTRDTQKMIVDLIVHRYPRNFKHQIDFSNWNEMSDYIRKHQRRYNG